MAGMDQLPKLPGCHAAKSRSPVGHGVTGFTQKHHGILIALPRNYPLLRAAKQLGNERARILSGALRLLDNPAAKLKGQNAKTDCVK